MAQAYHWLKWDEFRKEAMRVCRHGAVIAVWVYYRHSTGNENVDAAVQDFYENVIGAYWDYERKYVEEKYSSFPFDYSLPSSKKFESEFKWKREDFLGYISSWSAVQKFTKANGYSPMPIIKKEVKKLWPEHEVKKVIFSLYLQLGRVVK